jgi:hypothetical protein
MFALFVLKKLAYFGIIGGLKPARLGTSSSHVLEIAKTPIAKKYILIKFI